MYLLVPIILVHIISFQMAVWGEANNDDSYSYRIFRVLASLLFWIILYKIQPLVTKRSAEWHCRVVTLIHGVSMSLAAIYSQIIEGPNIFNTPPG